MNEEWVAVYRGKGGKICDGARITTLKTVCCDTEICLVCAVARETECTWCPYCAEPDMAHAEQDVGSGVRRIGRAKGRIISTFVQHRLHQVLTLCVGVGCGTILILVLLGVYMTVNASSQLSDS